MEQRQGPPDVILHNGKVLTVSPNDAIEQAVAVRGETIHAVGADRDLLDDGEDVSRVADEELDAVEHDVGPGVLPEEDGLADFIIHRVELVVVRVPMARAHGDDDAFLALLERGLGDDDAAAGLAFLEGRPDDYAVIGRS